MHSSPPPDLHPVSSSNLLQIGYWPAVIGSGGTPPELWVYFKKKPARAYVYFDVPAGVYQGLDAAASKGRFHRGHVRGKFAFVRLG